MRSRNRILIPIQEEETAGITANRYECTRGLVVAVILCALAGPASAARVLHEVDDINDDGASLNHSDVRNIFVTLGQRVFFWADDEDLHGKELYVASRYDLGSATKLTDFSPMDSDIANLTVFGDYVYFSADNGTGMGGYGNELWRTDGTSVALVANINSGANSSFPRELTVVGEYLYFVADDGMTGRNLWRLDSPTSMSPTKVVEHYDDPNYYFLTGCEELTSLNEALYLQARSTRSGAGLNDLELWKVAGSTPTCTEIDLHTTLSTSQSEPHNLVAIGNSLYCFASNSSGVRIVEYNGSIIEHAPIANDGLARHRRMAGITNDGTNFKVFYADGSTWNDFGLRRLESGQSYTQIKSSGSRPESLTGVGDKLYFSAIDTDIGETNGRQVHMIAYNDTDFDDDDTRLTEVNGTSDFVEERVPFGNTGRDYPFTVDTLGRINFIGIDGSDEDIYCYDNAAGILVKIGDFSAQSASLDPIDVLVIAAGGDIYFPASSSANAREPWLLTSGSSMPIKLSGGEIVACFYSNGDIVLKGTLTEAASGSVDDDTDASDFLILNEMLDSIARIDAGGNLYLYGYKSAGGSSISPSVAAFTLKDSSANLVSFIDDTGNLETIGDVYESDEF